MRTISTAAGILIASGWLFAQTSTSTSSAAPGGQAYTGILVDAACQQISGSRVTSETSGNRTGTISSTTSPDSSSASYGQTPSTSDSHQPTSEARMQTSAVDHRQVGAGPGSATDTRSDTRNRSNNNTSTTAGSAATNPSAGNTAPTGNYSSTSGTNSSSSSAATNPTTSNNPSTNTSRTTAGTTGSGYSSGTTGSGYSTGTTGSGYNSSPTGNANSGSHSNVSGTTSTTATGATGTGSTNTSGASGTSTTSSGAMDSSRNRSMTSTPGAGATTDYTSCRVTPATTSFALVSNGRVILLDPASNQRVTQQLQTGNWFGNNASSARDLNVSVNGSMQGENLSITTLSIQ